MHNRFLYDLEKSILLLVGIVQYECVLRENEVCDSCLLRGRELVS